jgi:hypothetical protein
MLMCKGNGCNWKKVCSRYVLGRAVTPQMDISVEWRDHCPHHQQDFIAVNSEEGRKVAEMLNKGNRNQTGEMAMADNKEWQPMSHEEAIKTVKENPISLDMTYEERLAAQKRRFGL